MTKDDSADLMNLAADQAAALVRTLVAAGMPPHLAVIGAHAEIVTHAAALFGPDFARDMSERAARRMGNLAATAPDRLDSMATHAGGRA
jgi:hypothetical protein